MDFYDRQYELKLTPPKGKPLVIKGVGGHGMDVSFNIQCGVDGCDPHGSVTIVGLRRDRISDYIGLSVLDPGSAAAKMMHLKLSVGYRTTGMFPIVSTYVTNGSSTPPPQLSLTLDVDESYSIGRGIAAISSQGLVSKKEAISTVLGNWGFKFDKTSCKTKDKSWLNERIRIPSMTYDITGARQWVRSIIGNRTLYATAGQIYIYDKMQNGGRPHWGTINKENGLIGVTDIDLTSCTIRSFLQDFGGALFPTVNLESEYNKQANRKYMVLEKSYKGSFRGSSWETILKCVVD